MYCINCGMQLHKNANFCSFCGMPINSKENNVREDLRRNETFYETMVQCPNCGSVISRLDATCRFCGAHIANKKASKTVKEFSEELMKIEESAPEVMDENAYGISLLSLYPKEYRRAFSKSMEKAMGNKTFEKKISLIQSFPIPNSVEEISEFILLAVASINVEYGKKSISNLLFGKQGAIYYAEVKLATSWINKMEQAYHKDEIAFPNDPAFQKIKEIYEKKMRELKRL